MSAPQADHRPLVIAADHGGVRLKAHLVAKLGEWSVELEDLGTHATSSVDYPDFAEQVARGVAEGRYGIGVLICGTGLGMSMMANRFRGVRAAVCTSSYAARMARAHNDANVLCLGGRVIGCGQAEDVLKTFLHTEFDGGRHARRIAKLDR